MKWRVMVESTGSDGVVRSQEVSAGGSNASECSAATVGLTLADGKRMQVHLVQGLVDEYCRQRRGCSHCGSQRPLKDVCTRRLLSLFGTVEVRAPRFLPCQCAVTSRHMLTPVAEIMPDRCTPEYERVIAKMGSLLPHARARALLSEFRLWCKISALLAGSKIQRNTERKRPNKKSPQQAAGNMSRKRLNQCISIPY
jgi:hypothetical protein